MPTEVLHTVDFIRREESESEEYPEHERSFSSSTPIPTPAIGERVDFGWYEDEDGEERRTLEYDEHYGHGPSVSYERSQEFDVVDVRTHYHFSEVLNRDGDRKLINRIEISTTVLVVPSE